MKRTILRTTSWLLSLALVIALLSVQPSRTSAADSIYFQFNDYSTEQSSPTEVNTNVIDISGTYSGISSSTITYKVEKIVGSEVAQSSAGSTRPALSGTNGFTFTGVSIFEGLNRITISGTNTAGNIVSAQAFVNFTNVPVISEIKLIDGRTLTENEPLVTLNASETLSVKAPNADKVTVNGTEMFGGSGSSFVLSGIALKHGYNELAIVASNESKTYQQTRYLVYFNGSSTAYNVKLGSQTLDGNPTFTSSTNPTGAISGQLVVTSNGASVIGSTYNLDLTLKLGNATAATFTATATAMENGTGYTIYSFATSTDATISSNGSYTLAINGPGASDVDTLPFTYLNSSSPYINSIRQAYNVTGSGTSIAYTSTASFADNSSLTKLPIWLVLDTVNFASDPAVDVKVEKNGADITGDASVTIDKTGRNSSGQPVIKISNLPAGQLKLTFTVGTGANSFSVVRNVTFFPAPAIQLTNIYDGQVFNDLASFQRPGGIVGQLLNFNTLNAAELNTLKVTLNGKTVALRTGTDLMTDNITDDGNFTLDTTGLTLVAGANTIVFEGVAGGVPVSTKVTVYLFSKDQPAVSTVFPVPYAINPTIDTDLKRYFSDSALKFTVTGDKEYTTTERQLDLLFDIKDLSDLEVQVNGTKVATAQVLSNALTVDADPVSTDTIGLCIEDNATKSCTNSLAFNAADPQYHMRLWNVALPQSGTTTITIILHKGTATVSQTVTIIRDLSPYIVLSPKLPNESVINANFLNVSIKAEGADQVLIGKTPMTKGEGDIFRYQMQGLKAGVNTVKFTVVTGSQKLNGSFQVDYAADDSVSAQYKTKLPKSGKISIFQGDLALQFPKNTFLRQANRNPGQDVETVDLFDAQNILFGIADRSDGRTVKRYNQVGEQDPSTHNFLDGTLKDIPTDSIAEDRLLPGTNFSFASNLFWIDAGYFDSNAAAAGDYKLVDAMDPYANGNMFYARVYDLAKWLEPSQRGTITLKYDSNISNAYATNLSVWRYTSNGWENVGGVVNTSSKTVSAPFDGFGYYVVMGLRYSFSDVIGHPYARTALESMFSHGIMKNKDSNSFGVYENITRGEFAQMLVKMTGVPLQYDPSHMTFQDVQAADFSDQYWNYRYVETAVKMGYIRGKQPMLFFPNDPLTREEASVMIARAFNLVKSNANTDKDLVSLQKIFTDASQVSTYSVSSVLAINKAGYITGIPNTVTGNAKATYRFEPQSFLSRADAAIIAERVLKKLKKL